jgi:hypothetical protein
VPARAGYLFEGEAGRAGVGCGSRGGPCSGWGDAMAVGKSRFLLGPCPTSLAGGLSMKALFQRLSCPRCSVLGAGSPSCLARLCNNSHQSVNVGTTRVVFFAAASVVARHATRTDLIARPMSVSLWRHHCATSRQPGRRPLTGPWVDLTVVASGVNKTHGPMARLAIASPLLLAARRLQGAISPFHHFAHRTLIFNKTASSSLSKRL